MDAKENALRIIYFDQPEWVMRAPPLYDTYYYGCHHRGFAGGEAHNSPVGTRWVDIWGTTWHKIYEGVMGLPKGYPIAEIESLRDYEWPDPNDERICGQIYQMAKDFPGGDLFLAGHHRDTLWEKSYMLVGMENMMICFLEEPEFAREILHRIMDFQMGMAEHYANVGIEYVRLGDDLGAQMGPLLSPRIINEFLVPEYRRLFQFYRDRDTIITFHSCGHVEPFAEMFIELGVDILNPAQATANDLDRLRSLTQGRMALHGGVSSAIVMDGPSERIHQEVHKRIWQLGQEGGYFCSPDQGMPYPEAHLEALAEAVELYGRYPLQPPPA